MKLYTKLTLSSFEDQVIYVGIDVHKENWRVSLVMNDMLLRTYSCDPDVHLFVSSLKKYYPGANFEFCYEAGFCGFWIYRKITSLGYKCLIVNPADIPHSQKEKLSKSDTIDSRKLARELSNNSLNEVYVPSIEDEARRDLLRVRLSFVKDQTRVKNKIKSYLNRYNILIPDEFKDKKWTKKFKIWLKSLSFSDLNSKTAFSYYLIELEFFETEILKIEKDLLKAVKCNEYIKIVFEKLKTIPGIGKICAVALIFELFNMKRFENDNELLSYIGIIPTTKNSGEKEYSRGVTFRHKKKLRNIIVEAAWQAIRRDPALLLAFDKLCKRMSKNRAIIRICKKLVRRIRSIWLNKKDYVLGIVA